MNQEQLTTQGKAIGPTCRASERWFRWLEQSELWQLAIPPQCVFCQAELLNKTERLCEECIASLAPQTYCCKRCAMPLPPVLPNDDCIRCRHHHWRFSNIVALGHYRGKLREAVILCKKARYEHLRYALALKLSKVLLDRFSCIDDLQPLILPVPYHWSRAFARTAATAQSLAELISRHTQWPVNMRCVKRIRRTGKQGMLSLAERKQNVAGAFQLRSPSVLTGRHLFVIDDVVTSGATVDEMSKQLRRAKPADITVVAIARATGS